MMAAIPESGTGFSDCTGTVTGVSSGSYGDSLEECQQKCLQNSDCNTINYCSNSAGCQSQYTLYDHKYCWVKKCTGDDYKIDTTTNGLYDIYTKMNGIFYNALCFPMKIIIAISLNEK